MAADVPAAFVQALVWRVAAHSPVIVPLMRGSSTGAAIVALSKLDRIAPLGKRQQEGVPQRAMLMRALRASWPTAPCSTASPMT